MLLMLASLAQAAPSLPELLEADAGRGAAFALACTSTRSAAAQLGVLGARALGRRPGKGAMEEAMSVGAALGSADAEAPLHVVSWRGEAGFLAEFGTSRTPEDIARLLAQGGPDATPEGAAWMVPAETGAPARVEATPGGVRVSKGRTPGATGNGLAPALRATLPDTPGCAVYLHEEYTRTGEMDMVLHLEEKPGSAGPLALATARMTVHMGVTANAMSALEGITFTPTPPSAVRTLERPVGVGVLGLGFEGLQVEELVEDRATQRALRRLRRALPVAPGTVVASFGKGPNMGASVPLANAWSARKSARRLAKVARALDARVTFLDATHLRIERSPNPKAAGAPPKSGGSALYAAGTRGGLLLASSPGILLAMEQGNGEPWVQGPVAEAAGRYPLVISTIGAESERLMLGVDLRDGVVAMRAELPSMLTLMKLVRDQAPEAEGEHGP